MNLYLSVSPCLVYRTRLAPLVLALLRSSLLSLPLCHTLANTPARFFLLPLVVSNTISASQLHWSHGSWAALPWLCLAWLSLGEPRENPPALPRCPQAGRLIHLRLSCSQCYSHKYITTGKYIRVLNGEMNKIITAILWVNKRKDRVEHMALRKVLW